MTDFAAELRDGGFARIRAISAKEHTLDLARRLGSIARIPGIAPVQELVPRPANQASASSYGGIYGFGPFPLHTDMAHWHIPPRYFLLRCVQPAPEVVTTALHSRLLFSGEDDLTLRRALFRPRRRIDGRLTCLRLHESGRYRWDPVFIEPLNSIAVSLRERLSRRLEALRVQELPLEDSSDCIILDNWSVLHGRTAVPKAGCHRKIERVYLDSVYL